jgi:hypothetical protein
MMISLERLPFMNEGMERCRTKNEPLVVRAWRDQRSPLMARFRATASAGEHQRTD